MVPRNYRYRCFDDCTQVSLHSRPRAKSFFYTRYTCQFLCAEYIAGNERRKFDEKCSPRAGRLLDPYCFIRTCSSNAIKKLTKRLAFIKMKQKEQSYKKSMFLLSFLITNL